MAKWRGTESPLRIGEGAAGTLHGVAVVVRGRGWQVGWLVWWCWWVVVGFITLMRCKVDGVLQCWVWAGGGARKGHSKGRCAPACPPTAAGGPRGRGAIWARHVVVRGVGLDEAHLDVLHLDVVVWEGVMFMTMRRMLMPSKFM